MMLVLQRYDVVLYDATAAQGDAVGIAVKDMFRCCNILQLGKIMSLVG